MALLLPLPSFHQENVLLLPQASKTQQVTSIVDEGGISTIAWNLSAQGLATVPGE
jgi:hypothetical protein